MLVFVVEILCIGNGNTLNGCHHAFIQFTHQQMYMVRHQTVSIDDDMRRQGLASLVLRKRLHTKQFQKLPVICPVLEDVLVIDAAHHHVVNTRCTLLTLFSRHILVSSFKFSTAKIRNIFQPAKENGEKVHNRVGSAVQFDC